MGNAIQAAANAEMLGVSGYEESALLEMLAELAEYLPQQSPIQFFVHHNTLHHLEAKPFREAVEEASTIYATEPYFSEERFAQEVADGRITQADIAAIVKRETKEPEKYIHESGKVTREAYRNWRLRHHFSMPDAQTLDWWLYEQRRLCRAHPLAGTGRAMPSDQREVASIVKSEDLQALWDKLKVPSLYDTVEHKDYARPRDALLAVTREDADMLVHPLLIRLCAAYLDQGLAHTQMPERSKGFMYAVFALYADMAVPQPEWLREFQAQCRYFMSRSAGTEEVIAETLKAMGVSCDEQRQCLLETLLALGGWAGMFHQYEHFPERIPIQQLPAKLDEFLAIRLLLDYAAAQSIAKRQGMEVTQIPHHVDRPTTRWELVHYEAFIAAQAFELIAEDFATEEQVNRWYEEIDGFDSWQRRYYLQLAYERHYRHMILEGLHAHREHVVPTPENPALQIICCMDEREESLRRHLEELHPDVETYGFAGFYGVAMQYKGLEDVTSRPLCPVVISPKHLVEEIAIDPEAGQHYIAARKRRGAMLNSLRRSRKSMLAGLAFSLIAGVFKLGLLFGHSFSPRTTDELVDSLIHAGLKRPATRLALERAMDAEPECDGLYREYTVTEMADIVFNVLNAMGMKRFSSIVAVLGHGSSSANNPHRAAYDCGATGGGRGGPNGRAFAMMANHPAVRKVLSARGLEISKETWFVGGFHNTSSDTMRYYDLDLVPESHRCQLEAMEGKLLDACRLDAHERCRRFEHAHPDIGVEHAHYHATQRAVDLAQPRPEYGHGSNAFCIIGRREKTRDLFMDRRGFLISYDPENDNAEANILVNILQAAAPVGAGISLEYYFSAVDNQRYGCGTKLPHNVTGLIGVMDGFASDLRTGLPLQTIEIHEPMRLLVIVEATPETLMKIAQERPAVGQLVANEWIQLVAWHPQSGDFWHYHSGQFVPHMPEGRVLPMASRSSAFYNGKRQHLTLAHIRSVQLGSKEHSANDGGEPC